MGNNNVYGEGHFITPNKVKKADNQIYQANINMENVFGVEQIQSKSVVNTNKSKLSQPSRLHNKKP